MRDRQSNEQRTRLIGLDYLRGFVIVMVVPHHLVLAYCRFGHFDVWHYLWSSAPIVNTQRWVGFDILALFCAAASRALLALFGGFERRFAVGDSLSANSYGIYLLHCPFVVWGQDALLDADIGASPKAAGVFAGAPGPSWCGVAALRRTVGSVVGFGRR